MSANKNAQLRYQILDRCFSNFKKKYTIDDLIEEVNEKLYDMNGIEVSLRQIREDIKFMRGTMPPSRLIRLKAGNATTDILTETLLYIIMNCLQRR